MPLLVKLAEARMRSKKELVGRRLACLLFLSAAAVSGCSGSKGSGPSIVPSGLMATPRPASSGLAPTIASIKVVAPDGKVLSVPTKPPGMTSSEYISSLMKRIRAEGQLRANTSSRHVQDASTDTTTIDYCTASGVDCGIQGTEIVIDWKLNPGVPLTTHVNYQSSGIPGGVGGNVVSNDVYDPPSQQPEYFCNGGALCFTGKLFDTTETLTLNANANPAMNYSYKFAPVCTTLQGGAYDCGTSTENFGVLCRYETGNCPYISVTDVFNNQVLASPMPMDNIYSPSGLEEKYEADVVSPRNYGTYFGVTQYNWLFPASSPPVAVADLSLTEQSSSLTGLGIDDTSQKDLDFYYLADSSEVQSVVNSVAMRDDDQEVSGVYGNPKVEIEQPALSTSQLIYQAVYVLPKGLTKNCLLTAGQYISPACKNPSTLFQISQGYYPVIQDTTTIKGTAPAHFGGDLGMTQLIRESWNFVPSSSRNILDTNGLVLDNCPIYPGLVNTSGANFNPYQTSGANGSYSEVYVDAPEDDLTAAMTSAEFGGEIVQYVMWRPSIPSDSAAGRQNRWVPVTTGGGFQWDGKGDNVSTLGEFVPDPGNQPPTTLDSSQLPYYPAYEGYTASGAATGIQSQDCSGQ